jgi:hypothetical protein
MTRQTRKDLICMILLAIMVFFGIAVFFGSARAEDKSILTFQKGDSDDVTIIIPENPPPHKGMVLMDIGNNELKWSDVHLDEIIKALELANKYLYPDYNVTLENLPASTQLRAMADKIDQKEKDLSYIYEILNKLKQIKKGD